MKYLVTYTNGFEVEVEASRMEDNGTDLKFFDADGLCVYWISDRALVCCEAPVSSEEFSVEEVQEGGGVIIKDSNNEVIASYRNYEV